MARNGTTTHTIIWSIGFYVANKINIAIDMYTTDEIIARAEGLNHRYNFKAIKYRNHMKNPISGRLITNTKYDDKHKGSPYIDQDDILQPEDIKDSFLLEGESNEYFSMYSNGLLVRHLKDDDENPYIRGFVESNVKG